MIETDTCKNCNGVLERFQIVPVGVIWLHRIHSLPVCTFPLRSHPFWNDETVYYGMDWKRKKNNEELARLNSLDKVDLEKIQASGDHCLNCGAFTQKGKVCPECGTSETK